MNRSLCLAAVIALAMAPETVQADDSLDPAVEQTHLQANSGSETSWYIHLDEARQEAEKTGKPLMLVFR